jgi:hypothetical protein
MQDQTKQIPSEHERRVQRTIVAQTLRDDHDRRWPRAELEAELGDTDALAIADALARLESEGVIELDGETVQASDAALHLDWLKMIAI